jgi:ATP-dependent Clp protease protease subunit
MNDLLKLLARNAGRGRPVRALKGFDPEDPDGVDGDEQRRTETDENDIGDGDAATVWLYAAIGGFFGDGVDAQAFAKAIGGIKAKTIHLRINSPGGDVFDARAMRVALDESPARIIAHVDGLAASAASFVMLAADEIEISPGAVIMIHNPWTLALGDAREMRATADLLDKIGGAILDDYAARAKVPRGDLQAMMDAETWLDADEAVTIGLADRVAPKSAKMSSPENSLRRAGIYDLSAFRNAPKAIAEAARAQADHFAALEAARARQANLLKLYT